MNKFESPCTHRPYCPGCPLIELPYPKQLEKKSAVLEEALGRWKEHLQPIVGATRKGQLGYRNRAKLVVGPKTRIGLYKAGTHRVVGIPECLIHQDRINEVVDAIGNQVRRRRITVYDEVSHKGFLRYLLIRQSRDGGSVLVTLVTRTQAFPEGVNLARALRRKFPFIVGVLQNINDTTGNRIEGDLTVPLAGNMSLLDRMGKYRFRVSATSFLQGNHAQAERLYETAASTGHWMREDIVYDLYSGIGLAGLNIANRVKQVVAVESDHSAVEDARATVKMNQMENIAIFPGETEKVLPLVKKRLGAPTAVIVNPPRTGCKPIVLQWLARSTASRITYISCNPKTLARDLAMLEQDGFTVSRLQGFDLYPQTDQIEVLAFLQR